MIDLTIADGIAEVVLNAPEKMNALNEEAIAELGKAYDDAAAAASRGEVRLDRSQLGFGGGESRRGDRRRGAPGGGGRGAPAGRRRAVAPHSG